MLKLNVKASKALFDVNDEATQKFNEQTTIVQVFMDDVHVANLRPEAYAGPNFNKFQPDVTLQFPESFLANPKSVLRLVVKDVMHCPGSMPGKGVNDDVDARVGTISFNKEYFQDVQPANFGRSYKQNITLFDEVDDDDFDGEFNEDDEELPIVRCEFVINDKQAVHEESTPSPQKIAPAIEQPGDPSGAGSQGYVNPKRVVKSGIVPPK